MTNDKNTGDKKPNKEVESAGEETGGNIPKEEVKSSGDAGSAWFAQNGLVLRGIAIGLGIAFAAVTILAIGIAIGQHKARFSLRWGQNYDRQFGGPRRIVPGGPRGFFGGHGTAGVVIKKDAKSLVVESRDNAEKVILVSDDTKIIERRQEIKFKDIMEDDNIVVIGSPDDKGRIKARLIRIFEGEKGLKKGMKGKRRGGLMWRKGNLKHLSSS